MVRCSLKRIIKIILCLFICIIIQRNLHFSSRSSIRKITSPLRIIILSHSHSKIIPRLILFFNELRLSYEYHQKFDDILLQNFLENLPSVIILDHFPSTHLSTFIHRYHIRLLLVVNEQCSNCATIESSEMLFENITYPTMEFHRDQLTPVRQSTASPFRIQPSNQVIHLLTFKEILPIFHQHRRRCFGVPMKENIDRTVIYVKKKITLEKINLFIVSSENEIRISECLFYHWFIWPIFMDILRYLTAKEYDYHGWIRHIQIDIDDVFLGGKSNDRWTSDDVQALIRSQAFIANSVKNFRYRLGFSGFYYEENQGDRVLMSQLIDY